MLKDTKTWDVRCPQTLADLFPNRTGYEQALGHKLVYVMGFMSDAQEMMAHGNTEGARRILNATKYLLSLQVEKDLS